MNNLTTHSISDFYTYDMARKDSRRSIKEYRSRAFFNRKDVTAAIIATGIIAYPFYRLLKRGDRAVSFMLAVAALPLLAPIAFT